MKLATYKSDLRDGKLVVVNQDLTLAVDVEHIAQTMQIALENWVVVAPILNAIYASLNQGRVQNAFEFDVEQCLAPLPRAYFCVHARTEPQTGDWQFEQARSDNFLSAHNASLIKDAVTDDMTTDVFSTIAAITSEIPTGALPGELNDSICLLLLCCHVKQNDVKADSVNGAIKGDAHYQKVFSPVAVTADECEYDQVNQSTFTTTLNHQVVNKEQITPFNINFSEMLSALTSKQSLNAGSVICAFMPETPLFSQSSNDAVVDQIKVLTPELESIFGSMSFIG